MKSFIQLLLINKYHNINLVVRDYAFFEIYDLEINTEITILSTICLFNILIDNA